MSKIKSFIITGYIKKRYEKIPFKKYIFDVKKESALEKLYSELGSRHKAKRFEIKINNVEEKERKLES